jgi:hypothetical protein
MATNDSTKPKKIRDAEATTKESTSSAPVIGGRTQDGKEKIEKKYWQIRDASGHLLEFFPIFVVQDEKGDKPGEVEVRNLEMRFTDQKGAVHTMLFDWMNIYMFVYYTANEELRQQLATRYERKVNYIPYDLTISISPDEARAGTAKRRVELPVDELTMAIAREEAWRIYTKDKSRMGDPSAFRYQKKGK